jgi:hypothetical protein
MVVQTWIDFKVEADPASLEYAVRIGEERHSIMIMILINNIFNLVRYIIYLICMIYMMNINFSRCEVEKRENRMRNFCVRELDEIHNAKALFRVFEA